jgi:hypothetical protein
LKIKKYIQPDPEATDTGRVSGWIKEYLSQRTAGSIDSAISGKTPFLHIDGCWYIFLDGLHTYARDILYEKIERNDLRRLLFEIGCQKRIFHVNHSERRTTATTFKVPEELAPVFCDDIENQDQDPNQDNVVPIQNFSKPQSFSRG